MPKAMSNPLSILANDTIRILSKDGQYVSSYIEAIVNPGAICVFDMSIKVDEGDYIERNLPGGKTEKYQIHEVKYTSKFMTIPATYEFIVRNINAIPLPASSTNNVYHLHGPNSRVYNQSNDQSLNIVSQNSDQLFNALRDAIKK